VTAEAAQAEAGQQAAEGECKTPGCRATSCASPWPEGIDASLYDAIVRQVRDYPGGAKFTHLVASIYGRHRVYNTDSEEQRRPSAEYQRVRRAVHDLADRGILRAENRPEYQVEGGEAVATHRAQGDLWLYPEWVPPHLKRSRHSPPREDTEAPNPQRAAGSLPADAPGGEAAQTARSVLRDRCSITPGPLGAGVRGALRHALAAHRQGVDSEGMRADRVSAPGRVAQRQAAYLSAWEAAAARYHRGVVCTVTARPGEAGDMVDSAVGVVESIGPLRKHLGRQTPGSGRPPAIVVPEVTERGVLHLHVAVFGVGAAAIDADALGRYWYETRGHGYVVDVTGMECRGRRWVWLAHAHAGTECGRYPRAYLGEMLHRFRAVAEADPATIHETAGRGWWKVALVWACGLPLVSISTELREATVGLAPRGGRVSAGQPRDAGPGLLGHLRRGIRAACRPLLAALGTFTRGMDPPEATAGGAGDAEA
jgi:hypothetical protein